MSNITEPEWYEISFPSVVNGVPMKISLAPTDSYFCMLCPLDKPVPASHSAILNAKGIAPAYGSGDPTASITAGAHFGLNLCRHHWESERQAYVSRQRLASVVAPAAFVVLWAVLAWGWVWFGGLAWYWQAAVMLVPAVITLTIYGDFVSCWRGTSAVQSRVQFGVVPRQWPIGHAVLVLRYADKGVALLVARHALAYLEQWRQDTGSFTGRLFRDTVDECIAATRASVESWSSDPVAVETANRLSAFTEPAGQDQPGN